MVDLSDRSDYWRVDRCRRVPLPRAQISPAEFLSVRSGQEENSHAGCYLKSLSKAERASFTSTVAAVVSRSTVFFASNNAHSLRTSFFGMRSVIGLRHWKRAPGSKLTQFLQV